MSSELERRLEELTGEIHASHPEYDVIVQLREAVRRRNADIASGKPPGIIVYEAHTDYEKNPEDRYLEIADYLNIVGRKFKDNVALRTVSGDGRHPSAYPEFTQLIDSLGVKERRVIYTRLRAPLRNQHLPHVPTTIGDIREFPLVDLAALRKVGPNGATFLKRTFAVQPQPPTA